MANLHLFFDGVTIPTGWTLVSDSGSPFYQKLVRGYSVYGGTGGSETHTHTCSMVSCTEASASNNVHRNYDANDFNVPNYNHTHTTGSTVSASNIPVSKSLKVIKYDSGIPSVIPTGAIAIFDGSVPSGWTRYSTYDDNFVYCDHTVNVSHGLATHYHSEYTISGSFGACLVAPGSTVKATTTSHVHQGLIDSDTKSNNPPYLKVLLGRSSTDNDIPLGMIGMFDDVPVSKWEVVSDDGDAFYEKFILPSSTYGDTGGSATHVHANISETLQATTNTQVTTSSTAIPFTTPATASHTHNTEISIQSESNLPPYINVIFGKYTINNVSASDSGTGTDVYNAGAECVISDISSSADEAYRVNTVKSTDNCGTVETSTISGQLTVSDVTLTDNETAYINISVVDSCSGTGVAFSDRIYPAYDSAVGYENVTELYAYLSVQDTTLSVDWPSRATSATATVERMMWRFSTAYDKSELSNLRGLIGVLASELATLADADIEGKSSHYVDSAYGMSLDYIGALHELDRKVGEADRDYRARIKTLPLIPGGTKGSLRTAISNVLGIDIDLIAIIDDYRSTDNNFGHIIVEFDTSGGSIEYDEATFWEIAMRTKAAGIKIDVMNTVERHSLSLADEGNACHRASITRADSLNWVCTKANSGWE